MKRKKSITSHKFALINQKINFLLIIGSIKETMISSSVFFIRITRQAGWIDDIDDALKQIKKQS